MFNFYQQNGWIICNQNRMVPKIGIKQFCVSESGKKGNEIKFDGAIDQHDNIFRSENIIDFFFHPF